MPLPIEEIQKAIAKAERFKNKQEHLFMNKMIVKEDLSYAYEITFLSSFIAFERFLESQFYCYLLGKKSSANVVYQRRIKFRSSSIAEEIVCNGKKYVDFLPYYRLEERAKLFLENGKPFTLLSTDQKANINSCMIIRNAIAHKSNHAIKQFQKNILDQSSLPNNIKTPSAYLRSQFSATSSMFDNHISNLLGSAVFLC